MKIIFVLISLLMASAYAQELSMGSYIKMQQALANDDYKTAQEGHKIICSKVLLLHTKEYKDCNKKFKDIDDLRNSFKKLSEVYLAHGNKAEMKEYIKASCPMAGAKWIQKNESLKNPYYGKSMLECGEKI